MTKPNIRDKINAKQNFVMNQSLIKNNAKRESCITKLFKTAVGCLKQS